MAVHFLFVFDIVFALFMIAWWASVGKELSSWLLACAGFSWNNLCLKMTSPVLHLYSKKQNWCGIVKQSVMQ